MSKSLEDYKEEITKHGADALVVLMKKHNLNPFDKATSEAMISMYQQGATKAMEIVMELNKRAKPVNINTNLDEIPF